MTKKIIVIGGGPAGMMAAGTAAQHGCTVTLIEKNKILGKKLLITGKGRCNVTNYCDVDNVISNMTSTNPKFMFSALNGFNCYDTYAFFEELGVPLKVERGNRVFPESDRAADIRNALSDFAKKNGVKIINETVKAVKASPLGVITDIQSYSCDAVIIATGGLSYSSTGSTGDGYRFASSLHHTIVKTEPSLVALTSNDDDCRRLAGLSLKNISVIFTDESGNNAYEDFGEMLFTHTGVSGPVILSASSKLNLYKHSYKLHINLKPALTENELDMRLLRDFKTYCNKDFINALSDLLPQKMIPIIVERSGIPPHQKVNCVTKLQRKTLCNAISDFCIEISGKAGYDEAIITAGGVDTSQVNPATMESKLVKGIYFAGEVLDISANTGGYNLQMAFSSARLAALACSGGKK